MPRLVIMGPPGAGKGTQSTRLSALLGAPAVSTGDLFRANVAEGTPLGRQVEAIMASGAYVPDEIVTAMVVDRLAQPDAAAGFLLDGYPRTVVQAHELLARLQSDGTPLDAVLVLDVDPAITLERLTARGQGRADDEPEVIVRRQELYREQTAPVIEVLGTAVPLLTVDAAAEIDEVTASIVEGLARLRSEQAVADR